MESPVGNCVACLRAEDDVVPAFPPDSPGSLPVNAYFKIGRRRVRGPRYYPRGMREVLASYVDQDGR